LVKITGSRESGVNARTVFLSIWKEVIRAGKFGMSYKDPVPELSSLLERHCWNGVPAVLEV